MNDLTTMLASAIALAVRLAPTFANEDGELIFNDLLATFPLTEDQADLIVTRACINAKAGSQAVGWALFSERLLSTLMGWDDDAPLVSVGFASSVARAELSEGEDMAGLL